jgi:hypothetical protein
LRDVGSGDAISGEPGLCYPLLRRIDESDPVEPVERPASVMGDGVDTNLVGDHGVDDAVPKAVELQLAHDEVSALAGHGPDLWKLQKTLDGFRNLGFESLGDLLILGSKALDVLVELRAGVGMKMIATSGRSLGHAP